MKHTGGILFKEERTMKSDPLEVDGDVEEIPTTNTTRYHFARNTTENFNVSQVEERQRFCEL